MIYKCSSPWKCSLQVFSDCGNPEFIKTNIRGVLESPVSQPLNQQIITQGNKLLEWFICLWLTPFQLLRLPAWRENVWLNDIRFLPLIFAKNSKIAFGLNLFKRINWEEKKFSNQHNLIKHGFWLREHVGGSSPDINTIHPQRV